MIYTIQCIYVYHIIQEDEIETLQAIYGDDFQSHTIAGTNVYSVTVSTPDNRLSINVQVIIGPA